MKFKNKVVFIVGGSSGIGFSLVESFLTVGAKVIICGRDVEKLNDVKRLHPEVETYICDVSNLKEIDALIRNIGEQIDVWVNNTGVYRKYIKIDDNMKLKDPENMITFDYFYYTVKIIPYLKKKKEAAIINLALFSNFNLSTSDKNYTLIKSTFHIFTNALRYHLHQTNIKVFEMAKTNTPSSTSNKLEIKSSIIENATVERLEGQKYDKVYS